MDEKKSETTTFQKNRNKPNQGDDRCVTAEQFDQWINQSLDELVASHSGFATTKSNRKYFSR